MIKFNEIRIDLEHQKLYVEAEIEKAIDRNDLNSQDLDLYKNVYLDHIEIGNQENFNPYNKTIGEKPNYEFTFREEERFKKYMWVIDITDCTTPVDFNTDMLFIKVYSKGLPSSKIPCGEDKDVVLGIAYNKSIIYNKGLMYLDSDICNPKTEYINFILEYYAFNFNIKFGNLSEAIKYWNKIKGHKQFKSLTNECGCR